MPRKRHKTSLEQRSFRIGDQIQRDLAELIRDLKDPRLGLVTLQAVQVTPDYAHAKIFFSVLTGDAKASQEALTSAAGFLRNALFKRLHIHTVPTLHFIIDSTPERAADMNALIARAIASRTKDNDVPDNQDSPTTP